MSVPRPLLKVGAAVFLLVMSAYSVASTYYNTHRFPTASLGLTGAFTRAERAMRVVEVEPAGPADRAGLRAGDLILAVNGRTLETQVPFWDAVDRGQPDASVVLSVRRPGETEVREVPVRLDPYHLPAAIERMRFSRAQIAALALLTLYPLPFLVVAGIVLVQRIHDRHAWLLAALFGGLIVLGLDTPRILNVIHPSLRIPLLASWSLFAFLPPGAFYSFFATFPEPTPLDRGVPWLKGVLLGLPIFNGVFLASAILFAPQQAVPLADAWSDEAQPAIGMTFGIYSMAAYGLGLASLVWNAFRAGPEARRRTRVMLWGTTAGVLPAAALVAYTESHGIRGVEILSLPFWTWVGATLALYLIPLSFAYAVVRHRVMELPVLLRRSARYVVVRHAIVMVGIVLGVALTFVFAWGLSQILPAGPAEAMSAGPMSGVAGAAFGIMVAAAMRNVVRKATDRVDRAFFREAYDARRLLQDLARRTRGATGRSELAALLESSLKDALHPRAILVLLRTPANRLEPIEPAGAMPALALAAAAVERELSTRGGTALVRPGELPASLASIASVQPELLVPMPGHDEQLEGLLVLGPRLSDEPYGREDRELVASVAGQAGTALENLRLATAVAEQMEAERRAGRELEIAREVQAKLLPQQAPVLESLDYAGVCIQAKLVGGDYYDFLYLGPGRLGLVLADISGKGISAALLMANLQASLRSHYAQAPDDLPRMLHALNRTFYDSTESSRYATLFFATYDEATSRLRYANCGHPPPLLIAGDGSVDRLPPTAPVIGLFEEWACTTQEVTLESRDTLVMFTDGVVEAFNADDEEFGEERLVEMVRAHANCAAATMVESLVEAVRRHSGPSQSDDFTLVIARGRDHPSRPAPATA
jgi:sigma-B regulation protein RsbU (phosphoserine phosphatase)